MSELSVHVLPYALTLGLILFNGFLVAAEYALAKGRQDRLEQLIKEGMGRAQAALRVTREMDASLSTAQLGAALAAIGTGWLAGPELARSLVSLFRFLPTGSAEVVAVIAALLVLAVLYVVLGQLAPRRFAARRPDLVVRLTGRPLTGLFRLLSPAIYGINGLAAGFLRLVGLKPAPGERAARSEDELKLLALKSHRHGLLGEVQRDLLASVFEYSERSVKDVMTPRRHVACVSASMRAFEAVEAVRQFGFTRYPVCDGDKDHVIGVVHFRDLVDTADAAPKRAVTDIMSSSLALPERAPVSEALKTMQARRSHLAVVVNEYGGTSGIVTTEDLLAELVGEGEAEDGEDAREKLIRIGPGAFEVDGSLIIEEIEDALDVDLHHAGVETIGGYVFDKLGRKPQKGDSLKVGEVVFDVLEVKGTKIRRLRAQKGREAGSKVN